MPMNPQPGLRPFLAFVLGLALLVLPAATAALTIDAATVTFNPKKTDAFSVKGRFVPFDIQTVSSVTLDFGSFTQTIPIATFAVKKGKLSFKGPKGAPGLASLTIDTVKGKFAASGKNLTLGPFENPAPLHLAAGFLDECSTLTFTELKRKRKLVSVVPACGFQGTPEVTPSSVFVGAPSDVRVRVTVIDDLALDLGSLVVVRLDTGLNPTGQVCTLHDDGSPTHGDDAAVDGVFSCRFTATEPAPARLRFAVRALRDTVLVTSPSFFLDVVTPLTDAEIATVIATQAAANDLWDAALAEHGESKKARKQTVAGILALPGVANAAIAADGVNIFIQYASGLEGGLDLDPVGVDSPGLPASLATREPEAPAPFEARILTREPAIAHATSAVKASHVGPRVGNNKVLIWSAFENESDALADATKAVQDLFEASTCPDFDVTVLKNEECTLASVGTFQDYGTVVLLTHGGQPRKGGPLAFMSREKATAFSTWYTHAEDLKLNRLLVYDGARTEKDGYFVFYPSFVDHMTTQGFPNSIVFAGACSSTLNRTMANAFFGAGALAYVGFPDVVHGSFLKFVTPAFFRAMLQPPSNAADAFARVPHKTLKDYLAAVGGDPKIVPPPADATLKTKLTLVRGDDRLAFPCEPPSPGLVETITAPAGPMAHVVGSVRLEPNVQYRMVVTGTSRTQGETAEDGFADYDAFYCFNVCDPPFPSIVSLFFYAQFADEEPSFSSLESATGFTNSALPPYDGGHRYEFPFTGKEGRLWVATWPSVFPDTGFNISGAYTVQIFRD